GEYTRVELAEMWGYTGYQALARGVVTPRGSHYIILFVTSDKQAFQEQYRDEFAGDVLKWEGPTDHFGEDRMITARNRGEQIHLFYRKRHHSDFLYCGQVQVKAVSRQTTRPSSFELRVVDFELLPKELS
ncbi:MAG: DUF3427 domain-containing protein, partial [Myxococcota bacterium]